MTKQTLSLSVNRSCITAVVEIPVPELPNNNWVLVLWTWPVTAVPAASREPDANIGMQPLSLATNDWVADGVVAGNKTPFVEAVAVKGVTIFFFFYLIINKVKFFCM